MGWRGVLIHQIREAHIGYIPVFALLASTLAGIIFIQTKYTEYAVLIVLVLSFLSAAYAHWYVDGLKMSYIQVDPDTEHPARNHYYREFDVQDGYIRFDVFVEVPRWMDEFTLKFSVDSPLDVGLWDVPNEYNDKDDKIVCGENAHSFRFSLSAGGDTEKLGTADRELRVIEENSGKKVASLMIKSKNESADVNYREHHK